ncbi:YetF domain-containing protein [Siphonobacter sp. SORGH_AS_0500]|uniref:YetF domain-containing protein n=1 Tax=Siphonobacter sp. SORGH_AS_0500 TaxID=1864824 RepID=UPI0028595EC9|nr:YetF domain-containing protein [Siphonobacter sp. SORGH_AS_0500]MDR6197891.1 uncharacterized membrane protein YcaP (DUF421 family) [Siphonobacter sp. SORGH_AS_0500]
MNDYEINDWARILLGDLPGQFLLEVTIRTLLMFIVIFVSMRATGKRAVRQLSIMELVLIVGLGSAAGDPMFYHDVGILPALIVFSVVILVYRGLTRLAAKSIKMEKIIEGEALLIVENGQFTIDSFDKEDLGQDEFFMELRVNSIEHLGQVRRAYIETNGQVSIFFFEEDEVKPGLPLLPEIFNQRTQSIPRIGTYACTFCGNVKELMPQDSLHVCPKCNRTTWVAALNNRRIK